MLLKIYRFLTPRKHPGIILPHGLTLGMPCVKVAMALSKFIDGVLDSVLPKLPSYLQPPPPAPPPEEPRP